MEIAWWSGCPVLTCLESVPAHVKITLTFSVNTGCPFPPLFLANVLLPLRKKRGF